MFLTISVNSWLTTGEFCNTVFQPHPDPPTLLRGWLAYQDPLPSSRLLVTFVMASLDQEQPSPPLSDTLSPTTKIEEVAGLEAGDDSNEPLSSPTTSSSHLLPSKSANEVPSQSTTPLPSTAVQSKPRIVGGFEIEDDDDDDEQEQENESSDEKDELDVYDPAAGLDLDLNTPPPNQVSVSAPAPSIPLDRTSLSPDQENGKTPAPVQANGSPAGLSSSALPPGADTLRATTATPTQPTQVAPAQATPPRSVDVNSPLTPVLPKTRLAHDVVGILQDRIKDDPRGDSDAYLELVQEYKSRNKQDDVRRVYDQYLTVFPLAVCVTPSLLMLNSN